MDNAQEPEIPIRYLLEVVKATITVWIPGAGLIQGLGVPARGQALGQALLPQTYPSPYLVVRLAGKDIHSTAPQAKSITPTWNESVKFMSSDPGSELTVELHHRSHLPGMSRTLGRTQISIEELEELTIFSTDPSVKLYDNAGTTETATVVLRLKNDEPPPPPKPAIPPNLAPELRPDFVPPKHPSGANKKMQMVGYSSQDVSMEQAERIVRQILSRGSANDSDNTDE